MTVGRNRSGTTTYKPVPEVAGDGFQIVRCRKRKGRTFHISKYLQIEGKSSK